VDNKNSQGMLAKLQRMDGLLDELDSEAQRIIRDGD